MYCAETLLIVKCDKYERKKKLLILYIMTSCHLNRDVGASQLLHFTEQKNLPLVLVLLQWLTTMEIVSF